MKKLRFITLSLSILLISCSKDKNTPIDNQPVGTIQSIEGEQYNIPETFKVGSIVDLPVGTYRYKASEKNTVSVKTKSIGGGRVTSNISEIEYAIPYGYIVLDSSEYGKLGGFKNVSKISGGTFVKRTSDDSVFVSAFYTDTCQFTYTKTVLDTGRHSLVLSYQATEYDYVSIEDEYYIEIGGDGIERRSGDNPKNDRYKSILYQSINSTNDKVTYKVSVFYNHKLLSIIKNDIDTYKVE